MTTPKKTADELEKEMAETSVELDEALKRVEGLNKEADELLEKATDALNVVVEDSTE